MAKKEGAEHASKSEEEKVNIEKVVIAACLVALVIAIIFLVLNKDEPYSVIYIKSYSNYIKDNVSFTYTVESHEINSSRYDVEVLLGNSTVQNDSFQLDAGSIDKTVSFPVTNGTQFPVKVEVIAKVNGRNYSVHFWLLGSTKLVTTLTPPVQQLEQQAVTTLTPPVQQLEQQAPPSTAMVLAAYAPWALGLLLLFIIALFLARRRKKKRKKKSHK